MAAMNAWAGESYRLTLSGALEGDRDLVVYCIRDGEKVVAAFGRGPQFNRMPYAVDSSQLKWSQDKLAGDVTVSIPFDGFVPKDGKTLVVKAAVLDGKYEATVGSDKREGAAEHVQLTALDLSKPVRLQLDCENAVMTSAKQQKSRRLGMIMTAKEGKVIGVRLVPPGSLTDVAMAAVVTGNELMLRDGKLTGRLTASVRLQGKMSEAIAYAYEFDGWLIGGQIAGTMKITESGAAVADGQFVGSARPVTTAAADALWTLTLNGVVPENNFLNLYLSTRDGKFTHGFGATPNFNNATHAVDVSKLTLEDGKLAGEVGVTVYPDPWVPKDKKPVACLFTIEAMARDGSATGVVTGKFGGAAVKGTINGDWGSKLTIARMENITLKLENALFGGSEYHNRAFVTVTMQDGKVVGGKVSNNHTTLSGQVTGGDVKLVGEDLTCTLTADVAQGGGVTAGTYQFTIAGKMVGTIGAGEFKTKGPGKDQTKTGRFWCAAKLPKD
jgi:hypothetical protein